MGEGGGNAGEVQREADAAPAQDDNPMADAASCESVCAKGGELCAQTDTPLDVETCSADCNNRGEGDPEGQASSPGSAGAATS